MKKLLPVFFTILMVSLNVSAQNEQDGKPSQTVKLFYTYVCDNDIDQALNLLSKKIIAQRFRLRSVLEFGAKECRENNGLESIDITEEKIKKNKATVLGAKTYKSGKQKRLDMRLVLDDGDWKVFFTPPSR